MRFQTFGFRLRGSGIAASISWLRLCCLAFAASALRRDLWLHGFGFVNFIFVFFSSRLRLSGFGFAARLWLREFGLASFRRRWFVLSLLLSLLASVVLVFNFMIAALRVHVAASASRLQFYGFGFAALASRLEFRDFAFPPSASA